MPQKLGRGRRHSVEERLRISASVSKTLRAKGRRARRAEQALSLLERHGVVTLKDLPPQEQQR